MPEIMKVSRAATLAAATRDRKAFTRNFTNGAKRCTFALAEETTYICNETAGSSMTLMLSEERLRPLHYSALQVKNHVF